MGYTPGQGIGKKESGISEPISIDLKTNRLGLGRGVRKKPVFLNSKKPEEENAKTDDFRGRMSQKKTEQLIEVDLRKSQKSCEQLDVKNEVKKPEEIWFWPAVVEEDKEKDSDGENEVEEDEDDGENDPECGEIISSIEKLEILTKYLREKYFYCVWCGATFDDYDDLRDNCPGKTRDDH